MIMPKALAMAYTSVSRTLNPRTSIPKNEMWVLAPISANPVMNMKTAFWTTTAFFRRCGARTGSDALLSTRTKMTDISAETGIHMGSTYNIFRDKEDIVCEIVIRDYAVTLEHADAAAGSSDLVKKVALLLVAEFRLARLNDNVARILSVAYASSKMMDALSDMQSRLLEEYCTASGVPMGIDVLRRRMCAINGLIGGLIACTSGGSIKGDAVTPWRRIAACSESPTCTTSRWWTRPSPRRARSAGEVPAGFGG